MPRNRPHNARTLPTKEVDALTFVSLAARKSIFEIARGGSPRDIQRAGVSAVRKEQRLHHIRYRHANHFIAQERQLVDIRLISSLNDDDEDRFASVLLNTMDDLLSRMAVAYHLRINTTNGNVLQRTRASDDDQGVSHRDAM